MKTSFDSIESWLKSNPSKEEKLLVLNLINRKAKSNLRVTYFKKERELKKLIRLQQGWKELGLASNNELNKSITDLSREVESLKSQLPAKRIISKMPKLDETVISETPKK